MSHSDVAGTGTSDETTRRALRRELGEQGDWYIEHLKSCATSDLLGQVIVEIEREAREHHGLER